MGDKIKMHVSSLGVRECDIWSGDEFDEFLRKGGDAPIYCNLKNRLVAETLKRTPVAVRYGGQSPPDGLH